ncbi:MAG TPA: DUF134 domain-containing protein [Clostridia bacterium]|nr:DUF134 domain-containing protein [Clostridia bacterium]
MPRPRKWRKVCCLPEWNVFGPVGPGKGRARVETMTVDEYETIRLIDYEGMTQEECAKSMNVARTTVQRIYNDARKKISSIFVESNLIRIEGGDYRLFTEFEHRQGFGNCRRHRGECGKFDDNDKE